MATLGYYDGVFANTDEQSLPFFARSHFFGDGIYEGCLCDGGRIMFLDEHIERFYASAEALDLHLTTPPEELCGILYKMLEMSSLDKAFIYFSAMRGGGDIRRHAYGDESAKILAFIEPRSIMDIDKTVTAITTEESRHSLCMYKTLCLFSNTQAARKAADAGVYECIFLERGVKKEDAHIHEATHSNIHILKNGILYSAPAGEYVLDGISRRQLLRTARAIGIEVREIPFTYKEMLDADEVIVTCSSAVCQRIVSIDGIPVSGRDSATLSRLQSAVLELRR